MLACLDTCLPACLPACLLACLLACLRNSKSCAQHVLQYAVPCPDFCCITGVQAELQTLTFDQSEGHTSKALAVGQATFYTCTDDAPADADGDDLLDLLDSVS